MPRRTPLAIVAVALPAALAASPAVAHVATAHSWASFRSAVNPAASAPEPVVTATPRARCGPGSRPEPGMQGRVPKEEVDAGRADEGYWCNVKRVAHIGATGGFRVHRYVDKAGHECAFYDSTLLFPTSAADEGAETTGTYVMDMSNPAHPVHTDTLRTPAMQTPHESLRLNQKRGLLVADMGYPTWNPGFVDVYDVTKDCRHPVLDSSTPMGVLGHEGGFAPDGKTFYVASLYAHTLAAVDLTNPKAPVLLWASRDYSPHGVSISNDGNRLYMAEAAFSSGFSGLTILDVSQIQKRVLNPQVPLVSRLTWPTVSTPQNATPFVSHGHHYLLETDEFGGGTSPVGGARIINIDSEKQPFVASNLRLAIDNKPAQTADPGDDQPFQGYQAHYCSLPSRVDPYIVACSFIMSGLRVFDVRDPLHPREIAYFNKPLMPGANTVPTKAGAFAMSAPAYDEKTHDIWYADGNTGFYVVRLTAGSGVGKFARVIQTPGN
jgi:hypothetical protein